jgi:type II secretory pathway component PulF
VAGIEPMTPLRKLQIKTEFTAAQRERLYLKLATYLRSGVKLSDAVDMLWRLETDDGRRVKTGVAYVLSEWRRKINNGKSFADAIKDSVPQIDYVVIKAGDESGRLDVALNDSVYINKAKGKMIGAIIGGLADPIVLSLMIIVFFYIFTSHVLPSFMDIMPREQWFGMPALLADVADVIMSLALPAAVVIGGFLGWAIWSMPRLTSSIRRALDDYPPWSIYKTLQGSGFLISLSALIKAGVKLPDALRLLGQGASPWLKSRIMAAQRHVSNGLSLGEALYRTKNGFPSRDIVMDMRAYSDMEGFEEILERIGKEWIEESVSRIKRDFDVIKNALIVVFGMMFIMIASGIFQMQDTISTSAGMMR